MRCSLFAVYAFLLAVFVDYSQCRLVQPIRKPDLKPKVVEVQMRSQTRINTMKSSDELKTYLSDLDKFVAINGRPRFGRSLKLTRKAPNYVSDLSSLWKPKRISRQ